MDKDNKVLERVSQLHLNKVYFIIYIEVVATYKHLAIRRMNEDLCHYY